MNAAHLFHVSEEPDIAVFHPRPPPLPDAGVFEDVVWAIDHAHLPNYLTPRNCPRVTFGHGPQTCPDDAARFLTGVAGRVVVIERAWLQRLLTTPLFVYAFAVGAHWRALPIGAGYRVSHIAVTPLERIRIDDPLASLSALGGELRVRENLWDLIDLVAASTLEFSIIRKRNAKDRPTQ
jgi:hypothetical protein